MSAAYSPGGIVRAQDVPEISGRDDLAVLSYATREDRVLLTHDLATMIPALRDQLRLRSHCASIVFVPDFLPVGGVIDDILLLDECAVSGDWNAGVLYLPLR